VFLVKNDLGQFGALKMVKSDPMGAILDRERRVLELGVSDIVPALLDFGSSAFGPYIVSAWKFGSVAADAFRGLRKLPSARAAMLRLAVTLVDAFERLH
jgi:hypothetical protein